MTAADFVRNVLPWFMSAITLYMTFLQGRKTWKAWLVGLVNQVLWLWFILTTQTWGLLLLNAGLWYLYVRNLIIWYNDEAQFLLRQQKEARSTGNANTDDYARFYTTTDELRKR